MHKLNPFLGEGLFMYPDLQDTFAGCYICFKNFTGACGAKQLAKCSVLHHSGHLFFFWLLLLGEL